MLKMKKIDRTNISQHLLDYQLDLIDKTVDDMLKDEDWHLNWTLTSVQLKKLRGYAIPLLKKTFKFNKAKAEGTFDWFQLQFGLPVKD
jgi:hypothetical protein